MRSPVFVQAIADAVGASSVRLCWTSPDRNTPAPPPESGLPAGRQYPDGEHYREIAGKLRDVARRCRYHTRGESSFTLPQITSGGAITSTAGRANSRHDVAWKERLTAARLVMLRRERFARRLRFSI